jgi:hypothetical protein
MSDTYEIMTEEERLEYFRELCARIDFSPLLKAVIAQRWGYDDFVMQGKSAEKPAESSVDQS